MTTGAVRMPSSQALLELASITAPGLVACQNRSTSSVLSRRRNAQPWLNPALGARIACSSIRSTVVGSTGRSAYLRTIRRRRTTSLNSMEPILSFEQMWRDLAPIGRSAESGGYFRQPYAAAETELRAWFVEACGSRGLEVETDEIGNVVGWWRPEAWAGPAY